MPFGRGRFYVSPEYERALWDNSSLAYKIFTIVIAVFILVGLVVAIICVPIALYNCFFRGVC